LDNGAETIVLPYLIFFFELISSDIMFHFLFTTTDPYVYLLGLLVNNVIDWLQLFSLNRTAMSALLKKWYSSIANVSILHKQIHPATNNIKEAGESKKESINNVKPKSESKSLNILKMNATEKAAQMINSLSILQAQLAPFVWVGRITALFLTSTRFAIYGSDTVSNMLKGQFPVASRMMFSSLMNVDYDDKTVQNR
jgi:hypothetical protein